MNNDFTRYIEEHIKDYLPEEWSAAEVYLETITKSNDRQFTALSIRRPCDSTVPTIHLEEFADAYKNGRTLVDTMRDIAEFHLSHCRSIDFDKDCLLDYDKAKPMLALCLCDPDINESFLKDKPHTYFGAFAVLYQIQVIRSDGEVGNIAINDEMVQRWGISVDDLHKDALASDCERNPAEFYHMDDMLTEILTGDDSTNLLDETEPHGPAAMYVLTNASRINGASVLVRDGMLERIGEIVGRDYYILPSSLHELLVVPDEDGARWSEFQNMVSEVNDTQLAAEDLLSYKVQRYDRARRLLEQQPREGWHEIRAQF